MEALPVDAARLKKYGFEEQEYFEEHKGLEKVPTPYPKPDKHYRLVIEEFGLSIEEVFFWMIEYMRFECNMQHILKITDIFSASEQSAFFGAAQQRLGIHQDKVSQFLATIGKMVKEMLQMVREMRQLDERLSLYEESFTAKNKTNESAEISLKGIWIDLVEQGSKNPSSVYGLAREMYFIALPDLFFKVHPQNVPDVEKQVDTLNVNPKLKEVLKRKLRTYLEWKQFTFKELKTKRQFTLKYLRQHYEVIKMYMQWAKPYLKNIQRMQLDQKKSTSPDLIAAFETSLVELEVLGISQPEHNKSVFSCLLCHWLYRTRPAMSFTQEGYQRGAIHLGKVEFNVRSYTWTEKQIQQYMKMKEDENLELLGLVDGTVKASLDEMGEEVEKYLHDVGDTFKHEHAAAHPHHHVPHLETNPFSALVHGVHDAFAGVKSKRKESAQDLARKDAEKKVAKDHGKKAIYSLYKDYKKFHGMMTW